MAKKLDKWESKHKQRLSLYQRRVDALYTKACRKLSRITANLHNYSHEDAFSFKNHPSIQQSVESVLDELKSGIATIIVDGINSEWTLANDKNNELSRQVFGDNVGKLSQAQYRRYFSDNDEARQAFLVRKENGLSLSDRVWNYTNQFKTEIELGLDIGLRNGLSADEMTHELKQYLKYPDKLFRRVRDERGVLQLSKAAADFHPGRGVYRSSYKNALRLAVTETNMAYRTADHNRIQSMDFVVGIRVVLSNNHTVNGMPLYDICDELSAPLGSTETKGRGCYPKDFKFTGWHPNCRCHVEFIQITQEEMDSMTQDILDGKAWSGSSVNEVKDVPEEFHKWALDNAERAEKSFSVPYFVKDNPQYLPEGYEKLYATKMPYEKVADYQAAMRYNRKHANFSAEQRANIKELNDALPVLQGQIMPFGLADKGHPNPNFGIEDAEKLGYWHNCQTCTMAYELRRRGFFVEAKPNHIAPNGVRDFEVFCSKKGVSWTDRWLTADGKTAAYASSRSIITRNTIEAKQKFIEEASADTGRYEVYAVWNSSSAHVFCIERQANGNLLWYDPQTGKTGGADTFRNYLKKMRKDNIGILRVDDKLINPKFAERLKKSSE